METKENGLCMHINNIITSWSFFHWHSRPQRCAPRSWISAKDLPFGHYPMYKTKNMFHVTKQMCSFSSACISIRYHVQTSLRSNCYVPSFPFRPFAMLILIISSVIWKISKKRRMIIWEIYIELKGTVLGEEMLLAKRKHCSHYNTQAFVYFFNIVSIFVGKMPEKRLLIWL